MESCASPEEVGVMGIRKLITSMPVAAPQGTDSDDDSHDMP